MTDDKKVEVLKAHTETYIPILEYTYSRTVQNFSLLEEKQIVCPNFCLDKDGYWHLEIRRNYLNTYFYLHRHAEQPEINVEYSLIASDLQGKIICEKSTTDRYSKNRKCSNLLFKDFLKNIDLDNDVIIFTVKLRITSPSFNIKVEASPTIEDLHLQALKMLQENYNDLYVNRLYADVILRIENQESLSVHKAILSARSPVFKRMFQQKGMVEQENNIVDIEDMDMEILEGLVEFLYSGELIDYSFETAMELYCAADKYAVMDLRQICGYQLISNLTKINAGRALSLAEQHDDQPLRDRVLEFILEQYQQDARLMKGITDNSEEE